MQELGKGKQVAGTTSPPADSKKPLTEKGSPPTAVSQSTEGAQSVPKNKSSSNGAEKDDLEERIEEVNKRFKQISSINLPIGWPLTKEGWPDAGKIFGSQHTEGHKIITSPGLLTPVKFLGIFLTALMVSLGSNFWFELLNKLLNLRNAGKKPLTKEEQEARKK
jgi:hypothetical protein